MLKAKMKKYLTFNNILIFVVAAYLIVNRLPTLLSNFNKEGQLIESQEHLIIENVRSNKKLMFPVKPRSIAIFWATWCAPCKLEMKRLSTSVEEGKIPSGAIVAINPFESSDTVRIFLKENKYPFTFIEDQGLAGHLNINSTPTTLFIENNKVIGLSSGLSFIGIWKAENFL